MEVNKIDIMEALDESFHLMHKPVEQEDTFSRYSSIYLAPTSNLKDTVNLFDINKDNKSALVVGSQGGLAFELLLKGYKRIDCFDKNVLQYMYFELAKTAIKNLDFKGFILFLTGNENRFLLADEILDHLIYKMDSIPFGYWYELQKFNFGFIGTKNGLFRANYYINKDYLARLSSIYNETDYYRLQKILNSNNYQIDYHICDIEDIPFEFEGKTYDLIMFDNIFQYYKSIPKLDNVAAANRFATGQIENMLNPNGFLQMAYGFQLYYIATKQTLNSPIPPEIKKHRYLNWTIEDEKKNGFIPQILKKYQNNYKLDFIPGAEDLLSQNVVLSRQKHL